jgi:hypothetical protein
MKGLVYLGRMWLDQLVLCWEIYKQSFFVVELRLSDILD